jgi:hypothetical protein
MRLTLFSPLFNIAVFIEEGFDPVCADQAFSFPATILLLLLFLFLDFSPRITQRNRAIEHKCSVG